MTKLQSRKTISQDQNRKAMLSLFQNTPIPPDELSVNLQLYMRSSVLAKLLYVNELYELIVKSPGVIMEFGVWWGANLALFENLRAVYEPYNYTRRIVGFDTFQGYASISEKDGDDQLVFQGNYNVTSDYLNHLKDILGCHQNENAMGHIEKSQLVMGDVINTLPTYLNEHPETIISLAYFDMQLYEPTKFCLDLIKPYLTKGSVIAMDELNCPEFPGETEAFREVFGTTRFKLQKSRYLPDRTYFIYE